VIKTRVDDQYRQVSRKQLDAMLAGGRKPAAFKFGGRNNERSVLVVDPLEAVVNALFGQTTDNSGRYKYSKSN
jgi:hypothetical protein